MIKNLYLELASWTQFSSSQCCGQQPKHHCQELVEHTPSSSIRLVHGVDLGGVNVIELCHSLPAWCLLHWHLDEHNNTLCSCISCVTDSLVWGTWWWHVSQVYFSWRCSSRDIWAAVSQGPGRWKTREASIFTRLWTTTTAAFLAFDTFALASASGGPGDSFVFSSAPSLWTACPVLKWACLLWLSWNPSLFLRCVVLEFGKCNN